MLTAKFKAEKIVPITILVVFFLLFALVQTTQAGGAYGWFSPKVKYINDTTPTSIGCLPNEASIDFWLVEKGTQTQISSNSGLWTVKVRDNKTSMTERTSTTFPAGVKASTPVCFDPNVNGLQIVVNDSDSYHRFKGPTLFPGLANLDSMKGKHFRGFLELEPKSDLTPSVESVSPNEQVFAGQPTFNVKTNSLSSSYGSNKVDLTRFYIINQADPDTAIAITDTTDRVAGANFNFTPTTPILNEGIYFWTFQQELNGATSTSKKTTPGFTWTFSQIPTSGSPTPMPFTIDKSAPTSTLNHSVISVSGSDATVEITNEASDTFGTLGTSAIAVYDGSLPVSSNSHVFVNTNNGTHTFTATLAIGKTYTVRATTTDSTGHITTSVRTITLSGSYAKPIINATNLTNTLPRVVEAFVNINGSSVTNWGTCWSMSNLSTTTFLTSGTCTHSTVTKNANFNINHSYSSIPNGGTVYMMAYAQNLGGTTTALFNQSLGTSSTNTLPVVEYTAPTTPLKSFSLDPGVKILGTGPDTGLLKHGICYFTSSTTRNATNIPTYIPSPGLVPANCRVWWNNANIFNSAYRNDFTGLAANTTYYFKVFAQNSIGWGYDIGEATTVAQSHSFIHLDNFYFTSPDFQVVQNETNFDANTNTYNSVPVRIAVLDESTDISASGPMRTIEYTATLFSNGTQFAQATGSVTANHPANVLNTANASSTRAYFNNVPLGTIRVVVELRNASGLPVGSVPSYDTKEKTMNLIHPDIPLDSIVGDETGSSSILIVDPQVKLWATPSLIRAGQSTTLNWSMNDVGADLQCEIAGPKTFSPGGTDGDGFHRFTANTSSNLTGTISSQPLQNTQFFRLKCVNGTDEFATTTRVNTIGTVQEI